MSFSDIKHNNLNYRSTWNRSLFNSNWHTHQITKEFIFIVTLKRHLNHCVIGFPSSPSIFKIALKTTENPKIPKLFTELHFSKSPYSYNDFSPSITWMESRDMLQGFITSFLRKLDMFFADDLKFSVDLLTNLCTFNFFLYTVAV